VELEDQATSKMPAESDEEKTKKAELKQMLLVSYLNLALCYLKKMKLKECIANCDNALKIDPKNVKAHFRKGLAYLPTKDYEKAIEQFDTVLELDPNNSEAKAKKAHCTNELANYYQKQKQIYKNLFA
jgi:Tfp pilus assembly protein PilF